MSRNNFIRLIRHGCTEQGGRIQEQTTWLWASNRPDLADKAVSLGDTVLGNALSVETRRSALSIVQAKREGAPGEEFDLWVLAAVTNPLAEIDQFFGENGSIVATIPGVYPDMSSPSGYTRDPDTGHYWRDGKFDGDAEAHWPAVTVQDDGTWTYRSTRRTQPEPGSPYWDYLKLPLKVGLTLCP